MRIFELQNPVKNKIKGFIDNYINSLTKKQPVKFLNYEPDIGYVSSVSEGDQDNLKILFSGLIAVYGHIPSFQRGSGSNDGTQNSNSQLIIDCYGFGDKVDPIGDAEERTAMEEAQRRAEAFCTLSYKAVMDRSEILGSPFVDKNFGVSFDILEKYPISIQKFPNEGTMDTERGISAYRMMFEFVTEENVPTEPLGPAFSGLESLDSETYNPGTEPEGV